MIFRFNAGLLPNDAQNTAQKQPFRGFENILSHIIVGIWTVTSGNNILLPPILLLSRGIKKTRPI